MERLSTGTRGLPPLIIGDSVVVQNQTGNYPSRWDITGVVVEVREHNQYVIKVDSSGRMTLRNRKFLQKMTQYQNLKHCRPDTTPNLGDSPPDPPTVPDQSPDKPDTESHPRPVQLPEIERAEPEQPTEPVDSAPPQPAPAPTPPAPKEVRRSARASKALDRLEVTGHGKSYDMTNHSISLLSDFHRSLSGGGGGITGSCCTNQQYQSSVWRPWK